MPRILVVEDDGDLLYLYDRVLVWRDYEVAPVARSADALLHLTNEPFDLIILDIGMPDISGLRILEFTHGDARLKQIPVIVVSANEQYASHVRAWGVQHFFVKPVKMQDLVILVDRLLQPSGEGTGQT